MKFPHWRTQAEKCALGKHAKLEWHKLSKKHPLVIDNQPLEILVASGFAGIAFKWNGFCTACGRAVEWSSHKPLMRDLDPKTGSLRRSSIWTSLLE